MARGGSRTLYHGAYGPIPPVLDGPWTAGRYTFVGDDLGRIDYAGGAEQLRVGSKIELLPPRCFQTVPLYSVYHCVSGDELVDIWPIQARQNW